MTPARLIVGPDGLQRLILDPAQPDRIPTVTVVGTTAAERERAAAIGAIARQEFAAYWRGECRQWSVPAAPQGTAFQQAVWAAIARVPYGTTVTYGTLAAMIGRPTAVRAVANACGKNPLPIRIPCHRIVARHGSGGYTGGLPLKLRLWALERITWPNA